MSQLNVERVLGRLVTDEGLRRRFTAAPRETLEILIGQGVELNRCEQVALLAIDARELERFVQTLHPGIQKVEFQGGQS
jgi:hypothetical protein